jgi:hypothetical protein
MLRGSPHPWAATLPITQHRHSRSLHKVSIASAAAQSGFTKVQALQRRRGYPPLCGHVGFLFTSIASV